MFSVSGQAGERKVFYISFCVGRLPDPYGTVFWLVFAHGHHDAGGPNQQANYPDSQGNGGSGLG